MMDTIINTETRKGSYPVQDRESGTLSTLAKECTTLSSPTRRTPTSAELNEQKATIHETFRKGGLGFRSVTSSYEKVYIDTFRKPPRPVFMSAEEVPVALRSRSSTTIAIVNPKTLCAYKRNATTATLESGEKQPDELSVQCLADLSSLQKKMYEQGEKANWEVYPDTSSGHLKIDGTFTKPKPRNPSASQKALGARVRPLISHSELLTEYYEKNQIVSYCVSNDDSRTLSDILADKRELEQTLGLAKLPFTVYYEESGSISVWFEEELQLTDNLANSEARLDDYANSLTIDPTALRHSLKMLSWPERTSFLNSIGGYTPPPSSDNFKNMELIKMLTTPDEYDTEKLKVHFNEGGRINFYPPSLWYSSPLSAFLFTEGKRKNGWSEFKNLKTPDELLCQKAQSLLTELIRCGAKIPQRDSNIFCKAYMRATHHLIDQLVAANIFLRLDNKYEFSIFYDYPDTSGTVLTLDQLGQTATHIAQKQLEGLLIEPFVKHWHFPDNYHEKLLILYYYGANPNSLRKELIEKAAALKEKEKKYYSNMCGKLTPEEHADNMIALWKNRESNPFFINWPSKVENAKKEIAALKSSLAPRPRPDGTAEDKLLEQISQPIVTAFEKPPHFVNAGDNQETVLGILDHYYRRPGPERILQVLSTGENLSVWKELHSCSHVLRARNNVHWYMELLEQFDLIKFTDDEKELLALAAVYHDAAAEDVPKDDEERQSAFYFTRDLADHYPTELVNKVGEALGKKEDDVHGCESDELDERLRSYMRVLRFGDRMDFIRCSLVGKTFPDWSDQKTGAGEFNVHLLDLPPQQKATFPTTAKQKPAFQLALEAAMHGAVDLAAVTGGACGDKRLQGRYETQHQLQPDNYKLQYAFEKTPKPISRMERCLNDNVRRMIAKSAGIDTCDPTDQHTCRANTTTGVSHGIHNSWHDLAQIQIPAGMSRLEKMQCGYNFSVLSETTKSGIEAEVSRLKNEGIAMNLGTLTQKTLKSPAAVTVLANRQIDVVIENRQRGWDDSNNPIVQKIAVPIARQKNTADSTGNH